jgi:hypothetical protein
MLSLAAGAFWARRALVLSAVCYAAFLYLFWRLGRNLSLPGPTLSIGQVGYVKGYGCCQAYIAVSGICGRWHQECAPCNAVLASAARACGCNVFTLLKLRCQSAASSLQLQGAWHDQQGSQGAVQSMCHRPRVDLCAVFMPCRLTPPPNKHPRRLSVGWECWAPGSSRY